MAKAESGRLPLPLAYEFLQAQGFSSEAEGIRTSRETFKSYSTSLRAMRVVALLEHNGFLEKFLELVSKPLSAPSRSRT